MHTGDFAQKMISDDAKYLSLIVFKTCTTCTTIYNHVLEMDVYSLRAELIQYESITTVKFTVWYVSILAYSESGFVDFDLFMI